MVELDNSLPMTISLATAASASVSAAANCAAPPSRPTPTSVPPPVTTTAKQKRKLPGMPDPDAEVIALSPTTLLATNRFVCEVCGKGFQRDQNLQLHRRGHNLPWKLRQRANGEKVRKRVYVCPEASCVHHEPSRALGDLTGIKKHFFRKHGERKWSCDRCSKKYAVQSDCKAHMKTCGTREYRCDCGTLFSRRDSFVTHRAFCDALNQETAARTQTTAPTSQPALRVETTTAAAAASKTTSSGSPSPPPPLTPHAGAPSPVVSTRSSELPDNQQAVLHHQQPSTLSSGAGAVNLLTSGSNVRWSSQVFAKMLPSSSPGGLNKSSQSPSSYSYALCAMARSEQTAAREPVSLSLCTSLYSSCETASLFSAADEDRRSGRYIREAQPPALSATALLQKAAQMSATSSTSSFLRGLGLAVLPSFGGGSDGDACATATVKVEGDPGRASGLGLGITTAPADGVGSGAAYMTLFGNEPATLDFLSLGMGSGGSSSGQLSPYVTTVAGGFDGAAVSFGGEIGEGAVGKNRSLL